MFAASRSATLGHRYRSGPWTCKIDLRTGSGKTLAFALPYLSMSRRSERMFRPLRFVPFASNHFQSISFPRLPRGWGSWRSSSSPAPRHASWLWPPPGTKFAPQALDSIVVGLSTAWAWAFRLFELSGRELAMQIAEAARTLKCSLHARS